MVDLGAGATTEDLLVCLLYNYCGEVLAPYFCGYCTEVLWAKTCLGDAKNKVLYSRNILEVTCLSTGFLPCEEPQDFWYHAAF